ncbi:hypothetical protein Ctob_004311 [Chrysochromulina tobinii]|uniref:Choline transporter-like protein n=1 Tax=Chrysochromulina tobinii TaxID=1460289 RepID=A0A0M0JRM6_9EUKA|nr:hypothetical protein Ctob_004311 [Chrysochromulina tobinii]|eukprot:KOO28937.1 hypothetical protein Ctob_004311 [Chrysochromulina sp. CCMP291]
MDTPLASTHSLAVTPQSLLKRKSTDRAFGVAYVIVLLVTFGIAIAAGLKNNIDGMLHDAQCGPQSGNINGTDAFTANAIVAEVPELLAIPIISVLIGMAWMGAMRACAKGMVYGTLIGQGLVLGGLTLAFLAIPGLTILAIFFGIIFAMYILMLFCARKKINLTATLIEQAATVVQVHPQVFLSSVLLMILGAIVYGACTAAALLLLTNGDWVLSNSTSDGVVTSGSGTTCQRQIPNAAVAGLSFVGFASLWSVEVFSAMRFYVVSFVTGVWYFKASGMAAQEGGSGTVTNPVTTATKLAFTKSFGTICLTALIMYIIEQLRRLAKKQSQNNGLAGVLIACCINCLVAYLEFITRFALTLHALTGDDLSTSARTFTSHLNRHGFSAVWVNWIANWVFHFGAFVLSLLITAICLVITSKSQPGASVGVFVAVGILSFIFAIVFLSFVAGILLNVIDACYSCLILDLDHGAQSQPQVAQAILIIVKPTYVIQHPGGGLAVTVEQPTAAVAYAQPYAAQPNMAYGQPNMTYVQAQPLDPNAQPPTAYARPIVSEYIAK